MMNRRRLSGWKIPALLLGIVVALTGGAALWIRIIEARRWAEMEKEVQSLLAEATSRDTARPVLYGEAVSGNAWDDYSQTIPLAEPLGKSWKVIYDYVRREQKAEPERVRALVAANPVLFDHLRRGAHRSIVAFPRVSPSSATADILMSLAICNARLLVESGKSGDAVHVLLDAAQLANDWGAREWVWTWGTAFELVDVLREIVVSQPLDKPQLEELDQALDRLDRSFPAMSLTTKNKLLALGLEFLKEDSWPREASMEDQWRYGFSPRLMEADAFLFWRREAVSSGIGDTAPWPEAQREAQAFQSRYSAEKNRLVRPYTDGVVGTAEFVRLRRAQIRLLRMAARARADGRILDLDDPFGAKLRTEEKAGRLRIWSVGRDGRDDGGDDGGDPAWFRRRRNGPPPAPAKDLVIEVSR